MSDGIFYYGCWDHSPGHYLYNPDGQTVSERQLPIDFPVALYALDGRLLPPSQDQLEGQLHIWRTKGWAIITFWDRSVDSRKGSHSTFIARIAGNPPDMLIVHQVFSLFRLVIDRCKFRIILPNGHPLNGTKP